MFVHSCQRIMPRLKPGPYHQKLLTTRIKTRIRTITRAMPHFRLFFDKKNIFNYNTPLHKRYAGGCFFRQKLQKKDKNNIMQKVIRQSQAANRKSLHT